MTVAGQTAVDYAYDDAHRLTSVAQGSDVVAITHDADRRSTLTFPNGIVVSGDRSRAPGCRDAVRDTAWRIH